MNLIQVCKLLEKAKDMTAYIIEGIKFVFPLENRERGVLLYE
jgi:hypothetical protein